MVQRRLGSGFEDLHLVLHGIQTSVRRIQNFGQPLVEVSMIAFHCCARWCGCTSKAFSTIMGILGGPVTETNNNTDRALRKQKNCQIGHARTPWKQVERRLIGLQWSFAGLPSAFLESSTRAVPYHYNPVSVVILKCLSFLWTSAFRTAARNNFTQFNRQIREESLCIFKNLDIKDHESLLLWVTLDKFDIFKLVSKMNPHSMPQTNRLLEDNIFLKHKHSLYISSTRELWIVLKILVHVISTLHCVGSFSNL